MHEVIKVSEIRRGKPRVNCSTCINHSTESTIRGTLYFCHVGYANNLCSIDRNNLWFSGTSKMAKRIILETLEKKCCAYKSQTITKR
jgi:hypothetical protein